MGHANEHGIKPIKKMREKKDRGVGMGRCPKTKKKIKNQVEHVGWVGCMWCMCAPSSWNSSTVVCRIALYCPPVKTVDAHLGEVWFGNSHLADWEISCYAAMPKHSSNAMLNSELNSLVATHKTWQRAHKYTHFFMLVWLLKKHLVSKSVRVCSDLFFYSLDLF